MNCYKNILAITAITLSMNTVAEEQNAEVKVRTLSLEDQIKIENTENKNQSWVSDFFERNLNKLIRLDENKILFMSNGWVGINSENGWMIDFVLGANDKFRKTPDDHGSTEYQLINIGDESVTIRYKSEFYHSSFGDNKKSIDEGTIEINYKK